MEGQTNMADGGGRGLKADTKGNIEIKNFHETSVVVRKFENVNPIENVSSCKSMRF